MYDQEWFEVYHAIMQEGIHTTDYDIPPLAPLRDAFVGFERDNDSGQPMAYERLYNI